MGELLWYLIYLCKLTMRFRKWWATVGCSIPVLFVFTNCYTCTYCRIDIREFICKIVNGKQHRDVSIECFNVI